MSFMYRCMLGYLLCRVLVYKFKTRVSRLGLVFIDHNLHISSVHWFVRSREIVFFNVNGLYWRGCSALAGSLSNRGLSWGDVQCRAGTPAWRKTRPRCVSSVIHRFRCRRGLTVSRLGCWKSPPRWHISRVWRLLSITLCRHLWSV
uniref:Uncharacterized protein n=1 Tax=Helianthus annuus TaxID=4232 RepID=A0A251RZL9_HELAN